MNPREQYKRIVQQDASRKNALVIVECGYCWHEKLLEKTEVDSAVCVCDWPDWKVVYPPEEPP